MSKTFCIAPYKSTLIDTHGNLLPCCYFLKEDLTEDNPLFKVNYNQYETWKNDLLKEVRDKSDNNEWHKNCYRCKNEEKFNFGKSYRTFLNETIGVENKTLNTKFLTLQFGNFCNFKCLMCSSYHSSQLEVEELTYKKYFKKFNFEVAEHNLTEKKWWKKENFSNLLNKISSETEHIFLHGGEPLITPEAIKFLKNIEKKELINLKIVTNASTLTDEIFDLLSKFKTTYLVISIDGIGELGELIRWGTNWEEVKRNILKFNTLPNSVISVNHVVQATSILSLIDVVNFVKENNLKINFIPVGSGTVTHFNLLTTDEITTFKNNVLTKLELEKHKIIILKILEDYKFDSLNRKKFFDYLDLLSEIRSPKYKILKEKFNKEKL